MRNYSVFKKDCVISVCVIISKMIAAGGPSTKMDEFLNQLNTHDIKKKLSIGNNLLEYIQNENNSLECNDIGQFIDGLLPWIQNSNYKVTQFGLDIYGALVERLGTDFRPYVSTIFGTIIDRLGDHKDVVRERCKLLLFKLVEAETISANNLFERLTPIFTHKNSNAREEGMNVLIAALNMYGAHSFSISRLVPYLVKLISDPNCEVRDTAFNTIVEIYRHVGDKLRSDLQKKHQVPQNKLPQLLAKFDELKAAGDVLNVQPSSKGDEDEPDRVTARSTSKTGAVRRQLSVSSSKSAQVSAVGGSSIPTSKLSRTGCLRKTPAASGRGAAGAVDEDYFQKAFEDVPSVPLMSHKEIDDIMGRIKDNICMQDYWEKRVEAMKKLRAVIISGGAQYNEVLAHIKLLDFPLEAAVKDLRSQVVREACITIAFLCQQLQNKMDHCAEVLLPTLMSLIQNSAKIISTSGVVCIRFVLSHTHAPRLVPIIVQHMTSKSTAIRRAACEFMDLMVHMWRTHSLERHIALLQDGIKKGISDPCAEARVSARKAFWGFKEHFPEQADALLNSLDASYKRSLYGEMTGVMSSSSSSNSIHHTGHMPPTSRTAQRGISRHGNDGITTPRRVITPSSTSLRSNSAIDLQAAQRAKARAQYSALARQKVGSGASLPRPKKIESGPPSLQASVTAHSTASERVGRTRSRVTGVSQSQPSSRSGSPSSRLNYATYSSYASHVETPLSISMSPRTRRNIPRSTGTSRETSPNRFSTMHSFGSKLRGRPVDRPPIHHTMRPPVMAHKMLQQSMEAESALADALGGFEPSEGCDISHRMSPRKAYRLCEDHSDDSETSSVCSERSFDSFRRTSDSFSWSGSQQRLYREQWEPASKDINEIIANCESTHWSDRKEGLVGLQLYLQAGNVLSPTDLKRITEIFTKMFMDSHTKVFSLFSDTLNELIITHRADLNSWLYVLLTRLLNKLGADLLGSIQTKIHKSLDVVRDSFPCELQMSAVLRFLVDATQTPNARVKTAALNYITKLAPMTDPNLAFPTPPVNTKDTATAALTKMIGWIMGDSIKQGVELRRASQDAIVALFNLNTPQVTLRLAQLPQEYQEAAMSLIHGRVRRSSSGGGTDTNSPPSPSPASPRLSSPAPQKPKYPPGVPQCDTENLNPEEVYKSLRRTTAEIQNYSYESGGKLMGRDTTSQDSGISQMSAGAGEKLEERMEELSIRPSNVLPLATNTGRVLTVRDCNGMESPDSVQGNDNSYSTGDVLADESESLRKVLESLNVPAEGESNSENTALSESDRKAALTQLVRLIKESSCASLLDNFKALLRILLSLDACDNTYDNSCKILVLGALTEMIKKKPLTESFNNYVELLILRVLLSYRETSKDVLRSAEQCTNTIATTLDPDMVIRILAPVITTADYPMNLGAVKMLTRLVEARGKDPVQLYLPDLMPGLVQAYDNPEISVRKSAVFCMVALHSAVGEEVLKPHLVALNSSKLKLLHVYIRKSQEGSSAPTSPKNHPPPSS